MALTTKDARTVAASYADGPCPAITAFAAGAQVSYEDFMAQLDMLASEYGFEAHDDVKELAEWAGNTEDRVWR
jgi:hypothetical protein